MCNNIGQNCLIVISGCNDLPSLLPQQKRRRKRGWRLFEDPLFFFLLLLRFWVSVDFALSWPALDVLMLYTVAYLQTGALIAHGPAAVLQPTPSSLSPGLLLCTEGNKDTRRISVVCLTKWLPESERAVPMGATTSPSLSRPPLHPADSHPAARASLRSALSEGALCMCDRLWVGEFMLMLKRQEDADR